MGAGQCGDVCDPFRARQGTTIVQKSAGSNQSPDRAILNSSAFFRSYRSSTSKVRPSHRGGSRTPHICVCVHHSSTSPVSSNVLTAFDHCLNSYFKNLVVLGLIPCFSAYSMMWMFNRLARRTASGVPCESSSKESRFVFSCCIVLLSRLTAFSII